MPGLSVGGFVSLDVLYAAGFLWLVLVLAFALGVSLAQRHGTRLITQAQELTDDGNRRPSLDVAEDLQLWRNVNDLVSRAFRARQLADVMTVLLVALVASGAIAGGVTVWGLA